jgi:hypothetical protein
MTIRSGGSMPGKGQKSITISEKMYGEIKRLVNENDEIFDNPTYFVKYAIADLILKVRGGKK